MEHRIIRKHILTLKKLCKKNGPQDVRDDMALYIAEAIQLQPNAEQKRSIVLFNKHLPYAIVRKKEGWHVRQKLHKVR